MNASRQRLPFTAFQHLPLDFSYSINRQTGCVELTITTSQDFAPLVMDGLQLLTQFAEQTKRCVDQAEREKRNDARQQIHRHNETLIQAAYWALRERGLRYRAAVHTICDDPTMPYHGQWDFTTYGHCVKASARPAMKLLPK